MSSCDLFETLQQNLNLSNASSCSKLAVSHKRANSLSFKNNPNNSNSNSSSGFKVFKKKSAFNMSNDNSHNNSFSRIDNSFVKQEDAIAEISKIDISLRNNHSNNNNNPEQLTLQHISFIDIQPSPARNLAYSAGGGVDNNNQDSLFLMDSFSKKTQYLEHNSHQKPQNYQQIAFKSNETNTKQGRETASHQKNNNMYKDSSTVYQTISTPQRDQSDLRVDDPYRSFASAPRLNQQEQQQQQQYLVSRSVLESAEFGGNLQNSKDSNIINSRIPPMVKNKHNDENKDINQYKKDNYQSNKRIQNDGKSSYFENDQLTSVLVLMQERFNEIEVKINEIKDETEISKRNYENNKLEEAKKEQKKAVLDAELLASILERISSLELKVSSLEQTQQNNHSSQSKQLANNQKELQHLAECNRGITEQVSRYVNLISEIEKKMRILAVKNHNDSQVERNYKSIIERLDKIDSQFQAQLLKETEEKQHSINSYHNKSSIFNMESYPDNSRTYQQYQDSINAVNQTSDIDLVRIMEISNQSAEFASQVKWLQEEIKHIKYRQDQFLSIISDLSIQE